MEFERQEVYKSKKILPYAEAIKTINELKKSGKKIGICVGAFDTLHPGHIKHFESAKKMCDVLLVSLTPDKFVSKSKGDSRPVYPQDIRAYTVACVEFVDFVVIADYPYSHVTIEDFVPHFFIKGSDYKTIDRPDINMEREVAKKLGTEMRYTDDPKFSTTELINFIKNKL